MKASINGSAQQKAARNVARIKTLRDAIAKAQSRGNSEREASLRLELERRMNEVRAVQETLAALDG